VARAPLLAPALAFLGAILLESRGLAAVGLVAACVLFASRRAHVVAIFLLAGVACATMRGHPDEILAEMPTRTIAGTIVGDVVREDLAYRFAFALAGGPTVRARVPQAVEPGERLLIRGRLAPFDEARNPGEPSPRAFARAEGLAGELRGTVVGSAAPDPRDARTWGARLREALSVRLRRGLREPEASVVAGALWGERGVIPASVHDDFQATGTVHVLVTAGLHLGVIAALTLALLRLGIVPRVPACAAAIVVVAAYAWLSGAHLPSERAAVMVGVALLARACGARIASWNALALAALLVAALRPASVGSVSFALSFSCVAAIVLFARPLQRVLERRAIPHRVREALALTVATQIGVWPLSAATFGLVAPYAIVANAIVVPATALAMLGGIATLCFADVPIAGTQLVDRAAAALTALDVDAILAVVRAVASLPGARLTVAPPPFLAIVAYDALALVAAAALRRSPRAACAILAAATVGVLVTTLRLPDGRLTITMLDVGQADAIVIRTPRGHVILVDSGGRLERGPDEGGRSPAELAGERIVLGYLRREGVREIVLLANTHPHADHVGGCSPIVQALRVDAILDSGQHYTGRAFVDCIHAAQQHGVPITVGYDGLRWSSDDGVTLAILAPSTPPLADTGDDVNENSVVVRLSYVTDEGTRFRALFMGDAGEAAEARLLARGGDLEADLLKVGHHGSRYASTAPFLAAVHPALALISVGRHNTFGHPAPETLRGLAMVGARTLRTDRCGAIRIIVDTAHLEPLLCR
jgi:competence protein ComEC